MQGDAIELDFAGAPPQLPQGGFNCTLQLHRRARDLSAEMHAHARACAAMPAAIAPFTVKAPEGSILNCAKPAAVNLRTRTGWYIAPNIFRALAEAAPAQVQAVTGLPVAINIYGRDADGQHLFRPSVHGRRAGGVGGRATASRRCCGRPRPPTPRSNCWRRACRCWCWRKPHVADSGGAGRIAAGSASALRMRKLHDDGLMHAGIGLSGGRASRRRRGFSVAAPGAEAQARARFRRQAWCTIAAPASWCR